MTLEAVERWISENLPALIEKYDLPGAALAVLAGGQVVDHAAGVLSKTTGVEASRDAGAPGQAARGNAVVGGYPIPVDRTAAASATGPVTLGVRPEVFRVVGEDEVGIPVRITLVEELGADAYLYGTCGSRARPATSSSGSPARSATRRARRSGPAPTPPP